MAPHQPPRKMGPVIKNPSIFFPACGRRKNKKWSFWLFGYLLKQAFLANRKKTQGEKNSKLKEKTKTQAQNSNFRHFLKKITFSENLFLPILNIRCVSWFGFNLHNTSLRTKLIKIAYKFCYCSNKSKEQNLKLNEKTQNSRKKCSKLKEKTQNSRGKLNFSAYSYVGQGEKMAKL